MGDILKGSNLSSTDSHSLSAFNKIDDDDNDNRSGTSDYVLQSHILSAQQSTSNSSTTTSGNTNRNSHTNSHGNSHADYLISKFSPISTSPKTSGAVLKYIF